MGNWINLDNLPRRKDGKIDWKNCNHNYVEFCYRSQNDSLFIERRINVDTLDVLFHDLNFEIRIISLQRCSLGKLYNFAIDGNFKYFENDIINDHERNLLIINQERINNKNKKTSKGYVVKCLDCGNIFHISEANINRGDGCKVCSCHKVVCGKNDLWTTRPDVANMLFNKSDGYKYMQYSNKKAKFICPNCKTELGERYISNVSKYGLSCPKCSAGISYPNRLMKNLLDSLEIENTTETVFPWCVFPSFNDADKMSYGRYDFVLNSLKLIIEMDGGFGHGSLPHPKSCYSKEELIYRDKMKDKLANENGYEIIRIDCDYSSRNRLDYISNNVINSNLSKYIDFSEVDWSKIDKKCNYMAN